MQTNQSRVLLRVIILAALLLAFVIPSLLTWNDSTAAAQKGTKPLEKPPEDQTYIGAKQCSACHFDQFIQWRQTKHSKAFRGYAREVQNGCKLSQMPYHRTRREDRLPGPQDAGPGWHFMRSLPRSRQQACGDREEFRHEEVIEGRRGLCSQHDLQDYARQRLRNLSPRPGPQKASAIRQKEVIGPDGCVEAQGEHADTQA